MDVGPHACYYTGASHTRSITEAKHEKSLLVYKADGGVERLEFGSRPIRAFGMDDATKDTTVTEIREWLKTAAGEAPVSGGPSHL